MTEFDDDLLSQIHLLSSSYLNSVKHWLGLKGAKYMIDKRSIAQDMSIIEQLAEWMNFSHQGLNLLEWDP